MNITDEHVTNILNDKVPGRSHHELSFMFMVRCARCVPNTVITGTPDKKKEHELKWRKTRTGVKYAVTLLHLN